MAIGMWYCEKCGKKTCGKCCEDQHISVGSEEYKTTQNEIDYALDKILKASGSALKYYSMPSSLENMRAEMLAIMKKSYVDGSNACYRAMATRT